MSDRQESNRDSQRGRKTSIALMLETEQAQCTEEEGVCERVKNRDRYRVLVIEYQFFHVRRQML